MELIRQPLVGGALQPASRVAPALRLSAPLFNTRDQSVIDMSPRAVSIRDSAERFDIGSTAKDN